MVQGHPAQEGRSWQVEQTHVCPVALSIFSWEHKCQKSCSLLPLHLSILQHVCSWAELQHRALSRWTRSRPHLCEQQWALPSDYFTLILGCQPLSIGSLLIELDPWLVWTPEIICCIVNHIHAPDMLSGPGPVSPCSLANPPPSACSAFLLARLSTPCSVDRTKQHMPGGTVYQEQCIPSPSSLPGVHMCKCCTAV